MANLVFIVDEKFSILIHVFYVTRTILTKLS